MKVASYDIVFQEIPGEVTLALNLSNCPCHCPGCHSPHLWEDIGEELDEALMDDLLERYGKTVTCVCFMGGDAAPLEVAGWAHYVKTSRLTPAPLRTAWYSGRTDFPVVDIFDYLKLGPYIASLGALDSHTTNQRFYRRLSPALPYRPSASSSSSPSAWEDITHVFRKKSASAHNTASAMHGG